MASRKCVLVEKSSSTSLNVETDQPADTDWSKCVICQMSKPQERLQCPANSKRHDVGAGYKTIAEDIGRLSSFEFLPFGNRINDGSGIEETLRKNKACWHNKCRLQYGKSRVERAEKRQSSEEPQACSSSKVTRLSLSTKQVDRKAKRLCFFCEKDNSAGTLHIASTENVDKNIKAAAQVLQDTSLLSKLSAGSDVIALDVVYHTDCLAKLYKRASAANRSEKQADNECDKENRGRALAELVSYIQDAKETSIPVFKLHDLKEMYENRLDQLGTHEVCHSTRLKDRLLETVSNLDFYSKGRDVYLVFKEDVGDVIHKSLKDDQYDEEALILAKAARIVRRKMKDQKNEFSGTFPPDCQEKSVPKVLLTLVSMILDSPNIKDQDDYDVSQASLSLSQLLMFNYREFGKKTISEKMRHTKKNETPLALYTGLMVHSKTRKKEIVDEMCQLGLSVSYKRVTSVSTDLEKDMCTHFQATGIVCPPTLRKGLVTSAAMDNFDHNPSSTTAKHSIHGTGISLFQQPTAELPGTPQEIPHDSESRQDYSVLPEDYTRVRPLNLENKHPPVPPSGLPQSPSDFSVFRQAIQKEKQWLDSVADQVLETETEHPIEAQMISWSGHHASNAQDSNHVKPCMSAILPLFAESSKSTGMLAHGLDVIRKATIYLNPDQKPITAADQPIFATIKQIQWNWPDIYGEDKFVVMMGGLHIEMCALNMLGDWVEGSGWVEALILGNITSSGIADSCLKVTHVTRTRHVHQVFVASLNILLHKAYENYLTESQDQVKLPFDIWTKRQKEESPLFQYWYITMEFTLLVLTFIRSIRDGNFDLYVQSLGQLAGWMFSLDHVNYARWIPVHLRDMMQLEIQHPDIYDYLKKGGFVLHKTSHAFSGIALDHAHEQNNGHLKAEGGIIGLTQNEEAMRKWMLAGPEVARVLAMFKTSMIGHCSDDTMGTDHHEQGKSAQKLFKSEVRNLVQAIEQLGNPFLDRSKDLITLDTKTVADKSVAITVKYIEKAGKEQYQEFVKTRLQDRTVSVFDPIHKNKFPLFKSPQKKAPSKLHQQIKVAKKDVRVFSDLYVSCQVRQGDMATFFAHENQAKPPALVAPGDKQSTKSDIMEVLESFIEPSATVASTAYVLDGPAIIHMLTPNLSCKTFGDYAKLVFEHYVQELLESSNRVDIVWDEYLEHSLKWATRENRGTGQRRRVMENTVLPSNWVSFLNVPENKKELFQLLSEHATSMHIPEGKQVFATSGRKVLSNPAGLDISDMSPCSHEEADTRIFVHYKDAVDKGHQSVKVRTVDSDVVVIGVAVASFMNADMWIVYGTGDHRRIIPAHSIAQALGPVKAKCLPVFHAFTGCDTVPSFQLKGKKSFWKAWESFDGVTESFQSLQDSPGLFPEEIVRNLERFVILVYDKNSVDVDVNVARRNLYCRKNKAIENIPPTKAALVQQAKRAAYQGGHVWGNCLICMPNLPCPSEWGWKKNEADDWVPLWTTLADVSQVCLELKRCGCKTGCKTKRCTCKGLNLKCTGLCNCNGDCYKT